MTDLDHFNFRVEDFFLPRRLPDRAHQGVDEQGERRAKPTGCQLWQRRCTAICSADCSTGSCGGEQVPGRLIALPA